MKAWSRKRLLNFKRPSGTSRGVLTSKLSYFILLKEGDHIGIGECSPLVGLSLDDRPDYEEKLTELITDINQIEKPESLLSELDVWPSLKFGLEAALIDLETRSTGILFPSEFTEHRQGIPINGLVWMGKVDFMLSQIKDLLGRGFNCIKMKIGAIRFEDELTILGKIRKEFKRQDLILRVDANGAFEPDDALEKLKRLSEYSLHSIEQPIASGQIEAMSRLCEHPPVDIALDEELIGSKRRLLDDINPQYIILKPSLLGGIAESEHWIREADKRQIGWWVTSALESNIGLNAISQWTAILDYKGHQGLGTGSLYTNNIASPLKIKGENLFYDQQLKWNLDEFY